MSIRFSPHLFPYSSPEPMPNPVPTSQAVASPASTPAPAAENQSSRPLSDEEIQKTDEFKEIRATIAHNHKNIIYRYQFMDGAVHICSQYTWEISGPYFKSPAAIEASYTQRALIVYKQRYTQTT